MTDTIQTGYILLPNAVNYQQDDLDKRVMLVFGDDYAFTNADLSEDMTLTESVNPDGDFAIGVAACAQLDFSLNNLYQTIPRDALTGREFDYYAGAESSRNDETSAFRASGGSVALIYDGMVYAGKNVPPYLTVWNKSTMAQQDDPEQPVKAVRALFVVNGTLYCVHDEDPYLTAYELPTMSRKETPALNSFQQYKVQQLAKNGTAFVLADGRRYEYEQVLYNGRVTKWVEHIFELSKIGVFIAERPERQNDNDISVTAYDRMSKTDVVIDDWNKTLTYPITAGAMLKSLCDYLDIELLTPEFMNHDFSIQKNYDGEGVTGRQVIQWIAQLAASFARMTPQGWLELTWYQTKDYTVDYHQYKTVDIAEYETDPVDKLQIRATENDIGVVVGDGENAYIIENNPLVYAEADAEIRPIAESIFSAIQNFSYTPYSASTIWGDPHLRAGDIITIETMKGQTIQAVIMNYTLHGIRALSNEFSATGFQRRETQSDQVNQSIIALRGKTNELTRTIEETKLAMGDLETGLRNEITITAEQLDARITSTDGSVSALTQNLNGLTQQVNTVNGTVQTLQSTVDGFSTTYATKTGVTNEIKSSIEGISLSVTNGTDYSRISLEYGGVTIATSSRIQFTGEVVFASDLADGVTSIDGACIDSGEINADYLRLYGELTVYRTRTGSRVGGYIGYCSGYSDDGIGVMNDVDTGQCICTNSGARLSYGGDTSFSCTARNISASQAISEGSDRRIKNSFAYDLAERYAAFYKALKPCRYKRNDSLSDRFHTGFVAQEIEDAVNAGGLESTDLAAYCIDEEGNYSVRYTELIALNTAMTQSLMARVEELERELAALKENNT